MKTPLKANPCGRGLAVLDAESTLVCVFQKRDDLDAAVLAVNSHAALVEACKEFIGSLEYSINEADGTPAEERQLAQARAALAQAGGGA
jgi:hypothetical protein